MKVLEKERAVVDTLVFLLALNRAAVGRGVYRSSIVLKG